MTSAGWGVVCELKAAQGGCEQSKGSALEKAKNDSRFFWRAGKEE